MANEKTTAKDAPEAPCVECNALLIGAKAAPHDRLRLTGFRQPSGEETYRCLECRLRLAFRREGRKTRWFRVYV